MALPLVDRAFVRQREFPAGGKRGAKGDLYVARLEALLDRGVLPEGFFQSESAALSTIGDAIAAYQRANAIKDFGVLRVIDARCGPIRLADLTYSWAEQWIAGLKRVHRLKPSTIRKHKGSLQRALNWVVARHPDGLPLNPL